MRSACDCEVVAAGTKRSDNVRLALLRAIGGTLRWDRSGSIPRRPAAPKILLIRPDHIGDVLLTTPSVELLRRALPYAHLMMMVGPWSEDVARRDPLLDEIAVCSFPGFTRGGSGALLEPYRLLLSVSAELSKRRYDAALVLRFDHWWGAWLSAAAGIPVRVGFGTPESRSFLNQRLPIVERGHWAGRSIQVAQRLLEVWGIDPPEADRDSRLRFRVRAEDAAEAAELMAACGFSEGAGVAVIHPGSGAALKAWPGSNWAEVGRRLSEAGVGIIVTGSPAETEISGRIAASIPGSHCLAGKTSLGTLAALFHRCDLIAGVDSGPMHLAVAVDTPSLRLYGPTDAAVFGPWSDPGRHRSIIAPTPFSPCNRLDLTPRDGESPACMRSITVDRVYSACRELLSLGGRATLPPRVEAPDHRPMPEVRP